MKSEELKFLEPSGSVQACSGTALPLPKFVGQIYKKSYISSLGSLFLFMTFIDIYVFEDTMNTGLWLLQFSGMLHPVTLLISVKSWKNNLHLYAGQPLSNAANI
jgi:hypothetical protein